jgi:hypothetical protein
MAHSPPEGVPTPPNPAADGHWLTHALLLGVERIWARPADIIDAFNPCDETTRADVYLACQFFCTLDSMKASVPQATTEPPPALAAA